LSNEKLNLYKKILEMHMPGKYWKARKGEKLLQKRREELDWILSFARADFSSTETPETKELRKRLGGFLLGASFPEGISADYLKRLQAHVRKRIQTIVDSSLNFWRNQDLWHVTTWLSLKMDPVKAVMGVPEDDAWDRFILKLSPRTTAGPSLNYGKALIDLRLAELIGDLNLQPSRFRVCSKCQSYFYQPTKREKNYCSPQCAGAARQARYEERKRVRRLG
jgi:hypothetical protein